MPTSHTNLLKPSALDDLLRRLCLGDEEGGLSRGGQLCPLDVEPQVLEGCDLRMGDCDRSEAVRRCPF